MPSVETEGPRREDQRTGSRKLVECQPFGEGAKRMLAAIVTRSAREPASILRIILPRCAFTVISLIPSSPPTCLFNRPRTTNRSDKLPAIEVYIIQSSEPPGGIGEPGTSGIVPVVTNAIFAATGKRLRKLPFDAAALKQM